MKRIGVLILCLLFAVSGCTADNNGTNDSGSTVVSVTMTPTEDHSTSDQAGGSSSGVKNVILLIGDGMGEGQRLAAQRFSVGLTDTLAMDSMPISGWARTAPLDLAVTDSAASATAMATGYKTYNNYLAIGADGSELPTILEYAQARGMSVGLVSTKYITDATPAAFASHVNDRVGSRLEIASQILAHGVDVILGGGEEDFLPTDQTGCFPGAGKRDDGRNLINEATEAGYHYLCDGSALDSVDTGQVDLLLGLFEDGWMLQPYMPSLVEMTRVAIEILSRNPNGFFLMVEGGMIDLGCHWNDAEFTITDTISFDEAVAEALAFAEADGETLVIVTADHETGGLRIEQSPTGLESEDGPFSMPDGQQFYVNWTTDNHTGADVPVTAYGPGSEHLTGTYENTHIFDVMAQALQLDLPEHSDLSELAENQPLGSIRPIIEGILGDVNIVFGESFENFNSDQYLTANYEVVSGTLRIRGDGSWSSCWINNREHSDFDASLIRFRFSDDADFVFGYQVGELREQGYCFWGLNEDGELLQMLGSDPMKDPLEGPISIKADEWFYGLFVIGEDGNLRVRVWEESTPVYYLEEEFTFGHGQPSNCAERGWWLTLGVGQGWVEIDDYVHFTYSSREH